VNGAGSAFERPFRIAYRPSPRVVMLLAAMHLGAVPTVLLSGIPGPVKVVASMLVIAALIRASREWRRAFRDPDPPILQLNARDEWRLREAGDERAVSMGMDCLSVPGLIILHVRDAVRGDRFFVLASDNAPADVLRRLRVRLRYPVARSE